MRFHGFGNDAPALGERDALYRGEELVLDARWQVVHFQVGMPF